MANAAWQQLLPNSDVAVARLLGRQDGEQCATHSTCSQSFGEGNIICGTVGCFNPGQHEKCCAGAGMFSFSGASDSEEQSL